MNKLTILTTAALIAISSAAFAQQDLPQDDGGAGGPVSSEPGNGGGSVPGTGRFNNTLKLDVNGVNNKVDIEQNQTKNSTIDLNFDERSGIARDNNINIKQMNGANNNVKLHLNSSVANNVSTLQNGTGNNVDVSLGGGGGVGGFADLLTNQVGDRNNVTISAGKKGNAGVVNANINQLGNDNKFSYSTTSRNVQTKMNVLQQGDANTMDIQNDADKGEIKGVGLLTTKAASLKQVGNKNYLKVVNHDGDGLGIDTLQTGDKNSATVINHMHNNANVLKNDATIKQEGGSTANVEFFKGNGKSGGNQVFVTQGQNQMATVNVSGQLNTVRVTQK